MSDPDPMYVLDVVPDSETQSRCIRVRDGFAIAYCDPDTGLDWTVEAYHESDPMRSRWWAPVRDREAADAMLLAIVAVEDGQPAL